MSTTDRVRDYYFEHLNQLSFDDQFHFCNRLAGWYGEPRAFAALQQMRSAFVPEPCTNQALQTQLDRVIKHPSRKALNAEERRARYFAQYPELRGWGSALFRVRHLLTVYGVDARPALFSLIPKEQLVDLKARLLNDPLALRTLSTFAVNYIYQLERIVLDDQSEEAIDVAYFYSLGKEYDMSDFEEIQLFIYFYAHCVIAESNFYARPLPPELLPTYTTMVQDLEQTIRRHFSDIHLDNKLEFLICCALTNYNSNLRTAILEECERSVSDQGDFLIDRHNTNPQLQRVTFETSEHRNVLYIMANEPFKRHAFH